MSDDPLLDHLEKTFAEAYRKEIDQEENVWRSLPFFAATLALQLTAIAQIRDWVLDLRGAQLALAAGLSMAAALGTLAALLFLARSVWPADFRYVAREPAFRAYAEQVRRESIEGTTDEKAASASALQTVKAALAEQYATAADNNRRVNQERARWRTLAGLATIASVFIVLVLVALAVVSHIHEHAR